MAGLFSGGEKERAKPVTLAILPKANPEPAENEPGQQLPLAGPVGVRERKEYRVQAGRPINQLSACCGSC